VSLLEKMLSEQCYSELVEKLAGQRVYIPKGKSNTGERIKQELQDGSKPEQIADRLGCDVRTVYRHK